MNIPRINNNIKTTTKAIADISTSLFVFFIFFKTISSSVVKFKLLVKPSTFLKGELFDTVGFIVVVGGCVVVGGLVVVGGCVVVGGWVVDVDWVVAVD
jgi:hypothetical protein